MAYGFGAVASGGTYVGNADNTGSVSPPAASAGALLLCVLTIATGGSGEVAPTVTAPSGWLQLGSTQTVQTASAGITWAVFYRWSTGSDPAVSFTFNASQVYKYAVQLLSWNGGPGSGAPTIVFGAGLTTSGTPNTAPTSAGAPAGTAIVELYSERSSTNAGYTNTSGSNTRLQLFGSGGGAVDLVVNDRLSVSGTVGGDAVTATTAGGIRVSALVLLPVAVASQLLVGTPI